MKRTTSAVVSFIFVFAVVFIIAGLFILPFVPPYPDRQISPFEGAYWYDNWPGLVLGLLIGTASAWEALEYRNRKHSGKS